MKKLITILLAVSLTTMLCANNIAITNLSITGQNTTSHYSLVQFDISWENSWRTSSAPNNWDAAWVFVKYRVPISSGGDGLWKHAWLNDEGHTAPDGSSLDIGLSSPETTYNPTTNPGLGVFIYRKTDGTGTNAFTGAQLRWNYGENYKTGSTPIGDNDVVDIQVYAIEMAYVAQGAFTVGSGGGESGSFTNGSWTSGATIPLSITSESALTIAHTAGNLWGTSSAGLNTIGPAGTLGAAFPKGYAAFYCMKYEISQQGYVDFLNTLSFTQQATRTVNSPASAPGIGALITGNFNRNGIDIQQYGFNAWLPAVYACNLDGDLNYGEPADGQWIACNFLSWSDLAGYFDWSGLRPMTELEFEKACRGTLPAVPGEYAWGSTSFTKATGISSTSGTINETAIPASANGSFGSPSINAPLRVGAFATASSTRVSSGATYYGIMEMSGNLTERMVTVSKTAGRAFTGTHGDGALDITGNANSVTWPGMNAIGIGYRGGDFNTYYDTTYPCVSDRGMAALSTDQTFHPSPSGGRGVRSVTLFTPYIGQSYGGGIIFYIDGSGQHGLIAAPSDQSTASVWGCQGTLLSGADGTAIGTGNQNTLDIMAGCSTAGIAARLCGDLVLPGYSDWYLPSKDELNEMHQQRNIIGGFIDSDYYSSSEFSDTRAWYQYFGSAGTQSNGPKNKAILVRAIRSF